MIIVRLLGGLGNQIFQYATAKHISILNRTSLKFDLSGFDKNIYKAEDAFREFKLTVFKLKSEIATAANIDEVKEAQPFFTERLKYRLLRKNIPAYRKTEIYEK